LAGPWRLRFKAWSGAETERMTIAGDTGNVGIGTTTPLSALSIIAGSPTTAATATQLRIGEPSNNSGYCIATGYFNDGGTWKGSIQVLNNAVGGILALQPNGGNVGIGTTTPVATLDVNGVIRALGANWPASGVGLELAYGSGNAYIQGYDRGASQFKPVYIGGSPIILQNGNVGIGTTGPSYQLTLSTDSAAKPSTNTWTIPSDIRAKRNVRPLSGGLDIIRALEVIEAEYNGEDATPKGKRVVSFDAAKVRALVPNAVTSHKGRIGGQATDVLDLNIHEIMMHLILAVQQLAKGN